MVLPMVVKSIVSIATAERSKSVASQPVMCVPLFAVELFYIDSYSGVHVFPEQIPRLFDLPPLYLIKQKIPTIKKAFAFSCVFCGPDKFIRILKVL